MSNIGKNPIIIPANTKIEINNNNIIVIGKLGVLIEKIPSTIELKLEDGKLFIKTLNTDDTSLWGTYRSIINNMLIGVDKGFLFKLKVIGVGYRAFVENKYLKLKIGYTNLIKILIPSQIKVKCINNTSIYLYGINLQQIKLFASTVRSFKKPDPYKGKGILFDNEQINFKEGKKK